MEITLERLLLNQATMLAQPVDEPQRVTTLVTTQISYVKRGEAWPHNDDPNNMVAKPVCVRLILLGQVTN